MTPSTGESNSRKNEPSQRINPFQPSNEVTESMMGHAGGEEKEEDEDQSELKGIKGATKEIRLANSKKLLMSKFSSYLEGEEVL